MASNLADPQAPVAAPVVRRSGDGAAQTIVPALSPVFIAAIALALHYGISDAQLPPLTWLGALPAWQHPYPVGLVAVAVGCLIFTAGQAVRPALRPAVRHAAPLVAGAIGATAVWELLTTKTDWLHKPFFPGPDEVFGAIVEDRVFLLECTWHSLRLLLAGYATGVVAGLVTGTVIGWFPRVRYWAMPAIKFIGPIPATALIHVAMSAWKDSFPAAVALIAFAVWFPMTILTSSGIAGVRLSYLEVARTLGAGRFYLIFRVALPAALPTIFVGLFMGLGASFLTLGVAETAGVTAGLGWYLSLQKGYMVYTKMYGALVLSGVFFSALMTLLFTVRDRVLSWQKGVIKW